MGDPPAGVPADASSPPERVAILLRW